MFKHTNSVLRDNDAQMELQTLNIYEKNKVYKHWISVLRVNAARMDKTTSPGRGENLANFNLHDYKVRYFNINIMLYIWTARPSLLVRGPRGPPL